jgi:hypothetical protein
MACGRTAHASTSFHCTPLDPFHPTEWTEHEELDGVTVTIRLIGDSTG